MRSLCPVGVNPVGGAIKNKRFNSEWDVLFTI